MHIGTWNIQGLRTKQNEVWQELKRYEMDITVLTETKKKGSGCEEIEGYIHLWSGVDKDQRAKRGVSIAIKKRYKEKIRSWEAINDRVVRVDIELKGYICTIIGVYAPNDNASKQEKDDFYETLTTTLESVQNRKECILMGDLNARTGQRKGCKIIGQYGEPEENENGERLFGMCEEYGLKIINGFYQHKSIHKYTWIQPTKKLQSIIDYIIMTQNSHLIVHDVRAQRGAECGTDHMLLRSQIYFPYTNNRQTGIVENETEKGKIQDPKYNLESLLHDSTIFLYKLRLAAKIATVPEEGITPAEMYNQIKDKIHQAAGESLGILKNTNDKKNKKPFWWNKQVEKLIKDKKEAYHKWLSSKNGEDRKEYVRQSRETKKYIINESNRAWEEKCMEINNYMGGTKSSESWKFINSLRNNERNKANLQPITEKAWVEHYSKLFTEDRTEFLQNVSNKPPEVSNGVEHEVITAEEVKKTISRFKNRKAPGPGGIPIELLKNAPLQVFEKLAQLFNMCLQGNPLPEDWRNGYVSNIHKKGKKNECQNYRGITVLSSVGRVYAKIISHRINMNLSEDEEQSGFRAGRSCSDNIFTLRQLLEKRLACGLQTHLAFIDLHKAYDSVPLEKLWTAMENANVNETYIKAVKSLYTDTTSQVKIGTTLSGKFPVSKGLRQGCCLAPSLFKIYLQTTLLQWKRQCKNMGIQIGDDILYSLHFADDQVLFAEDDLDMSYMLRKLIIEYAKWGLQINTDKTQYMVVGAEGHDLDLEDSVIKHVKKFKYLGAIFTSTGGSGEEIKNRMTQTKRTIRQLHPTLWSNSISTKTKKIIYDVIVQSIATYGSETWEITQKNEDTIKATEMMYWRRCCGLTKLDRIPNTEIKRRMGIDETIIDSIEKKRLIWYGHVQRMEEERWPRKILVWRPPQRKKRGRPKRTWIEGVREAMEVRNLEEEDWRDRKHWQGGCERRQT